MTEKKIDSDTPILHLALDFSTPLPSPNYEAAVAATVTIERISRDSVAHDDSKPLPLRPNLDGCSNPFKWTSTRRYAICYMLSIAAMLTTYAAGAYSPPVDLMAAEFGVSRTAVLTGTTTFCVGFALAPMLLAPFSEIKGRYTIFVMAGALFVLSQFLCGVVSNLCG